MIRLAFVLALLPGLAVAQSVPLMLPGQAGHTPGLPWDFRYVPTPLEWANAMAKKLDIQANGQVILGGQGWLEPVIGATEQIAQATVLAKDGRGGLFAATRTSYDRDPGFNQAAIGLASFVLNDNASAQKTAYGLYVEVRRSPNAYTSQGIEVDLLNFGNVLTASPYHIGYPGETWGLSLGAGRPDQSTANTTVALLIAGDGNNRSKWQTGIIFEATSVASGNDGYAYPIAIDMAPGYSFVWRNATNGFPLSMVRSDAKLPTEGGSLVFTASNGGPGSVGGLTITANGGANIILDGQSVVVGGTTTFKNGVIFKDEADFAAIIKAPALMGMQHASDTEAGAAGVLIGTLYVSSADGSVHIRRF